MLIRRTCSLRPVVSGCRAAAAAGTVVLLCHVACLRTHRLHGSMGRIDFGARLAWVGGRLAAVSTVAPQEDAGATQGRRMERTKGGLPDRRTWPSVAGDLVSD